MTLAKRTVAVIEGDDAAPEAVRPTIDLVKSLEEVLGADRIHLR